MEFDSPREFLSVEEEQEYARLAKNGNKRAKQKLIEANLKHYTMACFS